MPNNKKVSILPVNKTVVFNSPLEGDDDTLVRTGTIGDGSCFFHSVMYGCSKDYASQDRKGRTQFVKRLRASMAGNITKESWEGIGGGLIAKIPYQEKVYDILSKFYEFIGDDHLGDARGRSTRRVIKKLMKNDPEKIELYGIVTALISLDEGFNQIILKNAYESTSELKIDDSKKAVIQETKNYLMNKDEIKVIEPEKAEYVIGVIVKLVNTILDEAENSTFEAYVKNLKSVETSIDSYSIGIISDRIDRDIYVIDGRTRLPYMNASTKDNILGRKSIIVVWVEKNHYEVVGRLLPGNRIQREFTKDDPIIKKIYTVLVEPELVSEKYPNLVPYLPKEYQVSDEENDSSEGEKELNNSDSEAESDKYYDSSDNETEDDGSYVGSGSDNDQDIEEDGTESPDDNKTEEDEESEE